MDEPNREYALAGSLEALKAKGRLGPLDQGCPVTSGTHRQGRYWQYDGPGPIRGKGAPVRLYGVIPCRGLEREAMASGRVTVFGGSGFLGRQIVKSLAAEGMNVCVGVRHPERASFLERFGRGGQIELVHADVWDESTVAEAVKQSASVINTVGHDVEKGGVTFDAVHGQGALHVARQAAQAGVERLIHISGLGADPASDSPYVRARGIGEVLVKGAFDGVTVLRPSVIFGPDDSFFNTLAGIARQTPVLPLFGMGRTNLQPVYVGNVAEAPAGRVPFDRAATPSRGPCTQVSSGHGPGWIGDGPRLPESD